MATLSASEKLGAVAQAIADAFAGIVGVSVHPFEPVGELALPCITVGQPELERVELEALERQLGADDWRMSWSVTLQVAMFEAEEAQALARRLTGEMVEAIDLEPTLGGEAVEARLVSARGGYGDPEHSPRLIVVECEVQVIALMPRL